MSKSAGSKRQNGHKSGWSNGDTCFRSAEKEPEPGHYTSAAMVVERATVAAVATDPENRVIACNDDACELLEHCAEELIGGNFQELTRARDIFGNSLDPGHSALHHMVQSFENLQSFKLDVRRGSGARQRVGVSIVVVLGPEPGHHELVYLMTPIHRRRRADQLIDQLLAGIGVLDDERYAGEEARGAADSYRLTGRQLEVLRLLAEGKKAAEISDELCVSINTVRSHIRAILDTFEVSSQLEAVAKALSLRLI